MIQFSDKLTYGIAEIFELGREPRCELATYCGPFTRIKLDKRAIADPKTECIILTPGHSSGEYLGPGLFVFREPFRVEYRFRGGWYTALFVFHDAVGDTGLLFEISSL